jgi:hypothetical protein
MCEWRNTVKVPVFIPARLSHTGKDEAKLADIDECIAPLVRALNAAGLVTVASCCGHGKQPGSIVLEDGSEIKLCTFDQASRIDKYFSSTTGTSNLSKEERIAALRTKVQKRLKERINNRVAVNPPPRYDEIFFQGVEWLDSL